MDEVGLSSRGNTRDHHHHGREHAGGHSSNADKHQHRSAPRQANTNYHSQSGIERQYSAPFTQPLDGPRPVSSEQQAGIPPFDPYGIHGMNGIGAIGGVTALNGGIGGVNGAGFTQDPMMPVTQQQLQYQTYLAAQSRGVSPAGVYPPLAGTNFGYTTGTPAMDSLRTMQANSSPLTAAPQINTGPILGQPAFAGQSFSPVVSTPQMYQYGPQFYSQAQAPQGQSAGGRRGRMGHSQRV